MVTLSDYIQTILYTSANEYCTNTPFIHLVNYNLGVYCVNIQDASTIIDRDDVLTFMFDESSMYYYTTEQIYPCAKNIVETIISVLPLGFIFTHLSS